MSAAKRVLQAVSRLSRYLAGGTAPPGARDMVDNSGRDTPGHSDRPEPAGRSAQDEYVKD